MYEIPLLFVAFDKFTKLCFWSFFGPVKEFPSLDEPNKLMMGLI
jgi:beta-glucosidase/6-phospho-beta-glucosidase/beta-galactosidase